MIHGGVLSHNSARLGYHGKLPRLDQNILLFTINKLLRTNNIKV